MEQHNELLLIDQLDKMLSGQALTELTESLRTDSGAAAEWEYLKLAVEAVEYAAIYDRVDIVRKNLVDESGTVRPQGAVVRSLLKISVRIAAILIVFLGVAAIYKYSAVSPDGLYHEYYTSYNLGTVRGNAPRNALDEAYKNKNWEQVVSLFSRQPVKTAKTCFLTGMAELELQQYPQAISRFESVLTENARNQDNYFQDEAEYYLAMSYLMNKESDKGVALLNQIRNNKNHLYYPLANRISAIDLKIVDVKSKK